MKNFGLKPNDVTYNSLIDTCVRCSDMEKAWVLFSEMQDNEIIPDNFTFSTLIKGIKLTKNPKKDQRDLERAFSLLEQIKTSKNGNPDEILYNCLIDACIRLKDFHRAVSVFNEMAMSPIKPSSVTYGILIKAYGYANQLDNAFNAFLQMKENKLVPNDITYGCLIDACIKNGNLHRALKVYHDMKKDGIPVNTIIYTTLIKGYTKEFKLDEALAMYDEMKKSVYQPNTVTFNSLIDCSV